MQGGKLPNEAVRPWTLAAVLAICTLSPNKQDPNDITLRPPAGGAPIRCDRGPSGAQAEVSPRDKSQEAPPHMA